MVHGQQTAAHNYQEIAMSQDTSPPLTQTTAPVADHTAATTVTQLATITGTVSYRPGDGALIEIPRGPVEVALAPDSATLSWEAGEGVAGLTAIPRTQFDDYVSKGDIKLSSKKMAG